MMHIYWGIATIIILALASFTATDGEEKGNTAPVVADQSVDVEEDGSVTITLSGSDEGGDSLSFTVLSQPKNGILSGTAPALTYRPNAKYSGSDSFSYKSNDRVADSNKAVVAVTVDNFAEVSFRINYSSAIAANIELL